MLFHNSEPGKNGCERGCRARRQRYEDPFGVHRERCKTTGERDMVQRYRTPQWRERTIGDVRYEHTK